MIASKWINKAAGLALTATLFAPIASLAQTSEKTPDDPITRALMQAMGEKKKPPAPSPEQEAQYRDLVRDIDAAMAPYIRLKDQFDNNKLSRKDYDKAVTALNAGQQHPEELAPPESLTEHVRGCTADNYIINMPVTITFDLASVRRYVDTNKESGLSGLEKMRETAHNAFRALGADAIDSKNKADFDSPGNRALIDKRIGDIAGKIAHDFKITVTFAKQPAFVAEESGCVPVVEAAPPQP